MQKTQVLERDISRKHNLQHTFFMKKRPRMAVFGQKLSFSASDKHLKTPPPLFRGCSMPKSRFQADADHENTIYSMRMHQHLSFLMKKKAKNGRFLVKD